MSDYINSANADNLENMVTCAHCGQIVNVDETQFVDGDVWCEECTERDAFYCEHCDEYHTGMWATVHTTYRLQDIEIWCDNCVDDDAHRCEVCGEWYSDDCIREYDVWTDHGTFEQYICDNCTDEYSECYECGVLVHDDDARRDEYGDAYCPACYRDNSGALEDYSHTCAEHFYKRENDVLGNSGLFLGIELETEALSNNEMAWALINAIGRDRICCKKDSSLENGCEIVTQPMSPRYHLESGLWQEVSRICREYNATSHENGRCGLHIHVSRNFFCPDKWSDRVSYSLDRIFQRFKPHMINFSRRSECAANRWSEIVDNYRIDIKPDDDVFTKAVKWGKSCDTDGRYRAVNLRNSQTIEFRLFRGTLKVSTILATIQLITAICLLVKNSPDFIDRIEKINWSEFKSSMFDELKNAGISAAELHAYINARGL